jgi:hypothetical protein
MSENTSDAPAFAVCASVKIKALDKKGTVIARKLDDAGRWIYLVDRPHGLGRMRQHFHEDELE